MKEQEFFYTVEPKEKRVTKEAFEEFIKHYPRKLEFNVTGICDPPAISYNDFELANRWPYSVVARTYAYSDTPGDYYYKPEQERYYAVMENFAEVFSSKTGNKEED